MKMWNVAKSCGKNHCLGKNDHLAWLLLCLLRAGSERLCKICATAECGEKNVSIAWLSMCLTGMSLPIFRQ